MGEKNLNKDFTNTRREGEGSPFWESFSQNSFFFKWWLPLSQTFAYHFKSICSRWGSLLARAHHKTGGFHSRWLPITNIITASCAIHDHTHMSAILDHTKDKTLPQGEGGVIIKPAINSSAGERDLRCLMHILINNISLLIRSSLSLPITNVV